MYIQTWLKVIFCNLQLHINSHSAGTTWGISSLQVSELGKICFQSCTILYFFLSLYLLSNLSAHSLYTIVGKLRFLIWATLLCIIYSLSSLCSSTSRKKTASLIFFLQNRMMTLIIFFQPSFLTPSTMSYQWRTDKNVSFFRAIRDNCFENSSLISNVKLFKWLWHVRNLIR